LAIVNANRSPEDAELADALDHLGNPNVVTLAQIANAANLVSGDFAVWIKDRKNRRAIPHRLESCGYVQVRNEDAQDGLWKIYSARQVVYAKKDLPLRDQLKAAATLTGVGQ
jgi:hypothetical protein